MLKKVVRRQAITPLLPEINDSALARVLAGRGVKDSASLTYSLDRLYSPKDLKGLDAALRLLQAALREQKSVCIVGDFDADGATSTALCLRVLQRLGFRKVDYVVPNRFEYGYGLTPEIVALPKVNQADLILTVDNGISSLAGVQAAREKGIQVLITDHHLPGRALPEADAIVNPNQPGCEFPSKNLAGVGVAFYLLSALRSQLRADNWFTENNIAAPNMADYLDLVALGTVADVVPLDENNRILVEQGLRRIRAGKCCAGIKALLWVGQRNIANTVASDMGFAVGPRLNAAGRLDDMSLGIKCLLSDSTYEAENFARELNDLNLMRRDIEKQMHQEAMVLLAELGDLQDNSAQFGICLFNENWHEGVIGILASRVKEKFHRPTMAFAPTQNGILKGSGRSIQGVHLRDILDEIAAANAGMIDKFGGHAMAAGMSIETHKLPEFTVQFNACVARHLDNQPPVAELVSDGELAEDELNLQTALSLRNASPWGQAFPEPLFDGHFVILQQRLLKGKHLKLLLTPSEYSGETVDGILFNVDTNRWPDTAVQRGHLVYKLDINDYRGSLNSQLLVEQIAPAEEVYSSGSELAD